MQSLELRTTSLADLNDLYQFQLHAEARFLAAFMPLIPISKKAFIARYSSLLQDQSTNNQSIIVEKQMLGQVAKFEIEGNAEITYWVNHQYWKKGIATQALKLFLEIEKTRPLFGKVAFDNIASQKVLEKCGFIKTGTDFGFAPSRQKQIEEYIYKLNT